jgi:NAD(P)H-hydrate epimerase
MAAMDRAAIDGNGIPGPLLMERAGAAVFAAARQMLAGGRVTVVCGNGNNGGDGFVVARLLAAAAYEVRVVLAEGPAPRGDAAVALAKMQSALVGEFGQPDLVVDALFGTGLRRAVVGAHAQLIARMNGAGAPVLAVDLPSGICADTGAILGTAVRATRTVSFACAKLGHSQHPGAALAGQLTVADIGIPLGRTAAVWLDTADIVLPSRSEDAHKGSCGTVRVFAGSPSMPGAAHLALAGALRSGAGLVLWHTDEATLARRPPRAEVVLELGRIERAADAVVVGPGGARWPEFRMSDLPLCIDAGALLDLGEARGAWRWVLTPHPKEAAHLLGATVAEVQADRPTAARTLSARHEAHVILKGAGTVVASGDDLAVIGNGGPELASAGTGDVLAGIVGGLLAQGLAPAVAARSAPLIHAEAGRLAATRHGMYGTLAGDVARAVGQAMRGTH